MKKSISLFMAIIMLSLTPFQLVAKQAETSNKLISGTPVEVRTEQQFLLQVRKLEILLEKLYQMYMPLMEKRF